MISNTSLNHHVLEPGEGYTVALDSIFFGIFHNFSKDSLSEQISSTPIYTNQVLYQADFIFLIFYKYSIWPMKHKKLFRFDLHKKANGQLCWFHIPLK